MPVQVGEWLADLHGRDPVAAREVAAALVVLMTAEDLPGPPLVTVPVAAEPQDPREALDYRYQQLLAHLQVVRRKLAGIAARRGRAESLLEAMRVDPDVDPAVLADGERQLAETRQREEAVTVQARRLADRVDAYRSRKETIKAVYAAAEARARVREAFTELGEPLDDGQEVGVQAKPGNGKYEADSAPDETASDSPDEADADIRVLAADRLGADVRILFAPEPTGAVTLLTVLEGREAVDASMSEALDLARELLDEIRSDDAAADAPEDWQEFGGTPELLNWLAPESSAAIARRAASLATAVSLRDLRLRRGVTLSELARATGISARELATIERDGPESATFVHYLAAYLQHLGGRLELVARVDGEQHTLA
jgi:phage shock protein A